MGLKGLDLFSWLQTSGDKLRAQKSPQGLRHAGFQDFSGQFWYRRERILGLAESDLTSQVYVIINFYLIQFWYVYLNVYQLLDLMPRNGCAGIPNARR